jgi:hypothetical protein
MAIGLLVSHGVGISSKIRPTAASIESGLGSEARAQTSAAPHGPRSNSEPRPGQQASPAAAVAKGGRNCQLKGLRRVQNPALLGRSETGACDGSAEPNRRERAADSAAGATPRLPPVRRTGRPVDRSGLSRTARHSRRRGPTLRLAAGTGSPGRGQSHPP